jgi:ABC-type methionine transport system permease subunit
MLNKKLVLPAVVGLGLGVLSGVASAAAETIDYTAVTGAIATGGLVAAIMAVGLIKFAPQITKWGLAKLTSMFGG